jgi:hypothetical protein
MLFEPAHDADVRQTTRAAAAEGDADAAPLLLRSARSVHRDGGNRADE